MIDQTRRIKSMIDKVTAEHDYAIKNVFFVERELLCDSAVTDGPFDLQSDAVVRLGYTLYMAP